MSNSISPQLPLFPDNNTGEINILQWLYDDVNNFQTHLDELEQAFQEVLNSLAILPDSIIEDPDILMLAVDATSRVEAILFLTNELIRFRALIKTVQMDISSALTHPRWYSTPIDITEPSCELKARNRVIEWSINHAFDYRDTDQSKMAAKIVLWRIGLKEFYKNAIRRLQAYREEKLWPVEVVKSEWIK